MMAASRDLKLRLLLEDKASGQFKRVDAKLDGTGAKFKQFAGVAQAALAGVSASAVANFVKDMDSLATTGEAVQRRFDTVFGEMAATVSKWVDEQNEAFGLSETQLKSLAAGVQDLLVPLGFTRDEASGMTEQILTLGNALSEWTGGTITAESAVDRLRKAILGEREGLKELGIKISEADVRQQLIKDGTDQLTGAALEQARAQATLELALSRSADAMSAYADGADSALRKNKELQATASDLKDELARFLKPALDEGRGLLNDYADALNNVNEEFGGTQDTTGGAGQMFGGFVGTLLDSIPIFGNLTDAIREMNGEIDRLNSQGTSPFLDSLGSYGFDIGAGTPTGLAASTQWPTTVFPNATFNVSTDTDRFSDPAAARAFVRNLDREMSSYRFERQ